MERDLSNFIAKYDNTQPSEVLLIVYYGGNSFTRIEDGVTHLYISAYVRLPLCVVWVSVSDSVQVHPRETSRTGIYRLMLRLVLGK